MTALSFLFINLLLITTIIRPCFASESDPYTFSQLFINDSAPAINFVLENKIKKVVDELNRETSQLNLSDRDYVSLLMKKLYSKPTTAELLPGGKASLDRAFIGEWEHCIIWNNCEDWPKFERIVLRPGESVYDESNYSSMLRFLAPIFKLCGVRMGADKLTHMFDDGIGKFSLWLSQNYSLDQIYAVTLRAEFELMGARFSEVASPADVEAEIAGVKFFHDLLLGKDAFLCLDTRTKSLQIQKKIDICQYVNKNFDETKLKNLFTGKRKYELYDAIKRRRGEAVSETLRQEVLSREERDPIPLVKTFFEALGSLLEASQVPDFLQAYPYWSLLVERKNPDFKAKRNISICKVDEDSPPENENNKQFALTKQAESLYRQFENLRISDQLIGKDGGLTGPAVEELKALKNSGTDER